MSLVAPERPSAELEAEPWWTWLAAILPGYCTARFAAHHVEFWEWLWAIEPGVRPQPFVGIWARGGAKSTSAEGGAVALGARSKRRYALYLCDIQDRADDHVGNIGSMLESDRVEMFYPEMATRRVGKYGNSRGWRRNRLWTAGGFVVDAIGLDTAARGVKIEEQRPDLLVIDDIDGRHDSAATTVKKVEILTENVIMAGADDLAILAIQNLVKADGVFDRLASRKAEYLRQAKVSGPIPAIEGLEVERAEDGRDVITAGEPTWDGQSLVRCQETIDDTGLRAFVRECQHDVAEVEGALWSRDQVDTGRVDSHPDLDLLVVSVDPSGGKGKGHDEQGIVAVGRGLDRHGYVIDDATCSLSPMGWGKAAVRLAVELHADRIIVEDNYGGEMTANTVRLAADALAAEGLEGAAEYGTNHPDGVRQVNASDGSKKMRASPVAAEYGEKERPETWADAKVHHVGRLPLLEAEMTSWDPDGTGKSPNRIDALTHGIVDLGIVKHRGRRLHYRGTS